MTTHNSERERRIDEALGETFPASDTPFFVGAGAPKPNRSVTEDGRVFRSSRSSAIQIITVLITSSDAALRQHGIEMVTRATGRQDPLRNERLADHRNRFGIAAGADLGQPSSNCA
jgi:hypothetical protein